jgi:hypothetical protein
MSQSDVDLFFDGGDEAYFGPERDRYKRPMLIPTAEYPGLDADQRAKAAMGGLKVPYTRASSMANYIANFKALHTWQMRRLTKGLGLREDLAAMAGALPRFENDRKADRLTNARLDEIIEQAVEHGQIHEQANWGTAIHSFTDPNGDRSHIPERMKPDVESFAVTMERLGVKILDTEVFTANDRLKGAGTVDHVLYVPGFGKVLGDKKTGELRQLEHAVQFAIYRFGERYDWENDTRTPWDEDLSADVAFVIDISAGKGTTEFHQVDLRWGLEMAEVAATVRDGHAAGKYKVERNVNDKILEAHQREQRLLNDQIDSAGSREELLAIRDLNLYAWSDAHTRLARARVADLATQTRDEEQALHGQ